MAQTDRLSQTDAHDLVIISYNMHGFNQGAELVKHWCLIKSFDVLIVQEHWLSPATLYRFNDIIGPDYFCFSFSSMGLTCSSDVLRGRPFGGLAIIVKRDYINVCECVFESDRLVAILLNKVLIVNVYFPCSSKTDVKEVTLEVLGQLDEVCNSNDYENVIVGGDLNCNLDVESWSATIITEFLSNHDLVNCDCRWPDHSKVTYHHNTLKLYSCIDYFLCQVKCVARLYLPLFWTV